MRTWGNTLLPHVIQHRATQNKMKLTFLICIMDIWNLPHYDFCAGNNWQRPLTHQVESSSRCISTACASPWCLHSFWYDEKYYWMFCTCYICSYSFDMFFPFLPSAVNQSFTKKKNKKKLTHTHTKNKTKQKKTTTTLHANSFTPPTPWFIHTDLKLYWNNCIRTFEA